MIDRGARLSFFSKGVELSFLHTLEENANPVKIAISLNKSTKKKH